MLWLQIEVYIASSGLFLVLLVHWLPQLYCYKLGDYNEVAKAYDLGNVGVNFVVLHFHDMYMVV